ncbi:hypothetical protein SS41_23235 [Enterobacter hormaechei subsp. xiangfangensis]|uniref:hypothetical protein n=1 Tax=Enterobacter hormaechei TaxID=158836 RepID=UPI0005F01D5C|nr:hypothetical protein [Enterobacter hormaechei]KJN19171.1 hypothetical protein SS41_23235 [Enterobacter hormaechei subsp. xiangfangensis]
MDRKDFHIKQLTFGVGDYFVNPFSLRYLRSIKKEDSEFYKAFMGLYCKDKMEVLLGCVLTYCDYNVSKKLFRFLGFNRTATEIMEVAQFSIDILHDRFDCDFEVLKNEIAESLTTYRKNISET